MGAGLTVPKRAHTTVQIGFEEASRRLAIGDIQPLKIVSDVIKKTPKYAQIVASIGEIGIVEPPVVARDRNDPGKYLLLDGHLRIEALKDRGETEVVCLISIEDEAFTYNKRVNRIAIIQEHRMILKAIERGVSEERLAKSLNVDVASIKRKRRLLDGICSEAAEILKDKHVAIHALMEFKKLAPLRQIEAAELMVAMNKYTIGYARSLVAATPQAQLAEGYRPKSVKGLSSEQVALMERESANLDREFRIAEQSYGTDHLDLVLANGYLGKLLGNARVVRYLAQHQQEILLEFQKLVEVEGVAA
ncbi:MAG TPA: plasmid partitioning protein RepB C-terminal domain-containing protein [Xanthobacteraceae bacterium]|nr:plasmid partitioning protein RepB C-terminal domain-containing protein [Xanthobacteraceae bacterium]